MHSTTVSLLSNNKHIINSTVCITKILLQEVGDESDSKIEYISFVLYVAFLLFLLNTKVSINTTIASTRLRTPNPMKRYPIELRSPPKVE